MKNILVTQQIGVNKFDRCKINFTTLKMYKILSFIFRRKTQNYNKRTSTSNDLCKKTEGYSGPKMYDIKFCFQELVMITHDF